MFRLLFKIRTVHLRIKQEVELQIFFKKDDEKILVPHRSRLIHGIATFNVHYELFVSEKNPVFEINVIIVIGSSKKLAGTCQINLNDWSLNSNNSTVATLLKSPDSNAKIDFDFMYLSCDVKVPNNRSLISLTELQCQKRSVFMKQIEDKNIFLTSQNDRLLKQVQLLRRQNKQLTSNQQQMNVTYQKNSLNYQKLLKQKNKQRQNSQCNLNKIKNKMIKIEAIIEESGENQLKEKMKSILTQFPQAQL